VRGGLLTQASVLKVTANGTTTSPIVRGAWMMERILGQKPPPPPPSVPAVEPDIRGATTIRQQLESHRKLESCSACHTKIDPPGFALESFDIVGGYRKAYRAIEGKERELGFGKNGQKFTFHNALPVESHGQLGKRNFADIREFKALLVQNERQLARNLVGQLRSLRRAPQWALPTVLRSKSSSMPPSQMATASGRSSAGLSPANSSSINKSPPHELPLGL